MTDPIVLIGVHINGVMNDEAAIEIGVFSAAEICPAAGVDDDVVCVGMGSVYDDAMGSFKAVVIEDDAVHGGWETFAA